MASPAHPLRSRLYPVAALVALGIGVAACGGTATPVASGPCHADGAENEVAALDREHRLQAGPTPQSCDEDRVASDEERRRMEAYLADFVRPEDVVQRLETPGGDQIDCVDVRRQPALRRPGMEGQEIEPAPDGEPDPSREAPVGRERDPAPLSGLQAPVQDYARGPGCPEGSVPIRHLTMDTLKNFRTLEEFFHKEPPHLLTGPTADHQYAYARRNEDNWGSQAALNVWSPYTERANEFSLSQLWIARGDGDDLETVEAGWQKYRDFYGDYRPRLFIFFTPDNYGDAGCYNLTCSAFVQTNNTIFIGGGFTSISEHPHPSTAWEFTLRWQKNRASGSWWLKYGDTWVGYYPRSLFDEAGLVDHASEMTFGGEIVEDEAAGHTATDMGSGHFPADGFGFAAYQRAVRGISTSNVWMTHLDVDDNRDDADCYDIELHDSGGDWERYFYFGGPGFNGHCQ